MNFISYNKGTDELTISDAKLLGFVTDVIAFAKQLSKHAKEFVFIDELKYLVRGGRVTKTKAFFADLLHRKPIISPEFDGGVFTPDLFEAYIEYKRVEEVGPVSLRPHPYEFLLYYNS